MLVPHPADVQLELDLGRLIAVAPHPFHRRFRVQLDRLADEQSEALAPHALTRMLFVGLDAFRPDLLADVLSIDEQSRIGQSRSVRRRRAFRNVV